MGKEDGKYTTSHFLETLSRITFSPGCKMLGNVVMGFGSLYLVSTLYLGSKLPQPARELVRQEGRVWLKLAGKGDWGNPQTYAQNYSLDPEHGFFSRI